MPTKLLCFTKISQLQCLHLRVINAMAVNLARNTPKYLMLPTERDRKSTIVADREIKIFMLFGEAGYFHILTEGSQTVNKIGETQIMLILDNALPTPLIFLPPNTTSKLQPMDQGITNNFNLLYKKEVVRLILFSIEQTSQQPDINILCTMQIASKTWFDVKPTTIPNCFRKME
ncbi:hypothetical protein PR048_013359 [Dryococelus australis]|uniref:DDE-1 domain-containing protein n=1 Tax=Dryococelus australis TaxID=614101 RepID=A0ABQ9HRY3_9NEOP|nr:hypothetical protein PR048_013359 [Dryococelus australis]